MRQDQSDNGLADLVTTEWLAANRGAGDVVVLDATWFLPSEGRAAAAEYEAAHVPGAVRFDIDAVADRTTTLPHMLPTAADFARAVGAMGIGNDTRVVVYDRNGMAPAARVWWTFQVFGHDGVAVLDGGLPKWQAEGRALEAGSPKPAAKRFSAGWRPELVANLAAVGAIARRRHFQLVDARPPGRFHGSEPEPRPGLRGGHVPGSTNLPYRSLLAADGTLLPTAALQRQFAAAGLDTAKPVVALCGSGVTASLIAFALRRIGARDAAVYDGSWAEWGARDDVPIAT